MMICHPSSSGISGRFISIKGTASGNGGSAGADDNGGGTTTFLFRTFGIRVRVTSDDLDLLRKL